MKTFAQFVSEIALYHGTNKEFKHFDLDKAGQRDPGNLGKAVYLHHDPHVSWEYGKAAA